MRGEGISTPHVRHKGRQPLIECANMTLIFYVPFLCLYILYTLFIFFSFCGRQGCFPLLLRIPQFEMRKSDLRSSFLSSDSFFFCLSGDHFKALDLKNDPFYLVRNCNDKFSKPYFLWTSLTRRVDFSLSFTLVISQFD